jgi:hypothetical protein
MAYRLNMIPESEGDKNDRLARQFAAYDKKVWGMRTGSMWSEVFRAMPDQPIARPAEAGVELLNWPAEGVEAEFRNLGKMARDAISSCVLAHKGERQRWHRSKQGGR